MEEHRNVNINNYKVKDNKKTIRNIIITIFLIGFFVFWWYIYPATVPYKNNGLIYYDPLRYPDEQGNMRPIIHLYSDEDKEVKITMSNPEKLVYSNPEYNNYWMVKTKKKHSYKTPAGTVVIPDDYLEDENGNIISVLSWGIEEYGDNKIKEEGFVIKGKNTGRFLDNKLSLLGLNFEEKNEFLSYLLPELEKNKYNYIRFQTMEEINNNMELFIEPKPDTLIRIMMEYKPLDKKIKVKQQELTKVERKGYTVVEWGGTKIN